MAGSSLGPASTIPPLSDGCTGERRGSDVLRRDTDAAAETTPDLDLRRGKALTVRNMPPTR